MKLSTRDIVYIGFIAALCAVATTIRIEIPGGAMVHLGSAALFTTSILLVDYMEAWVRQLDLHYLISLVVIHSTSYSLSLLKELQDLS